MDIKTRQRIAISTFFFLSGLSFSSWASRIPTLKDALHINEAELGTLLFIMPISQLIGIPLSGWLVSKFDSRWPLIIAFVLHAIMLLMIGLSSTIPTLVVSMFLYAFFMRILNIAMNTQSINLQKIYTKRINGSFHGLWSFGGIAGVGITTLMIAGNVSMKTHLLYISILLIITTLVTFRNLIPVDRSATGNKLAFGKPDKQILLLGIIILFAAICEGGMFDWSGVYFKEVVKVEIFTAGYLIFMTCMAISRIISDYIIQKIGMRSMYKFSAGLITVGMLTAVLFPSFWMAMIGFSLVGFGTASVVPMTFVLSGTSEKYSPGIALSIVVTYAMIGILLGPVLIGYIAHAINLRASFLFMTLAGIAIIPISRFYFKHFNEG